MPDFSARAALSEWMDDDEVDFETFAACLKDLARVNAVTAAYRPTLGFLQSRAETGAWPRGRPLRLLDVGSGYGDALRTIDRWCGRRNLSVVLTGLDRNPWAARAAEAATAPDRPIRWLTADLFDHDGEADVIVSSLFTHHLDGEALVRFLAWMDGHARIGWLVNDLERHPLAYYGFSVLSRLAGWHSFVRHDGPISIRRAFSATDWRDYLAQAGVRDAQIRPWTPFRLCVSKLK